MLKAYIVPRRGLVLERLSEDTVHKPTQKLEEVLTKIDTHQV